MQPNGTPEPRRLGRPRGPRVEITCVICGRVKELPPSRAARGEKVCSRACAGVVTRGPRKSFATAFWAKVNKADDCWLWTASLTDDGYGRVGVGSSLKLAHRVSWELEYGEIPEGIQVRHRCPRGPQRACVRPDHLRLGTIQDNMQDRTDDGNSRTSRSVGERNAMAKLSEADIQTIRRLRGEGWSSGVLAAKFGVHRNHISRIVAGVRWRHVE